MQYVPFVFLVSAVFSLAIVKSPSAMPIEGEQNHHSVVNANGADAASQGHPGGPLSNVSKQEHDTSLVIANMENGAMAEASKCMANIPAESFERLRQKTTAFNAKVAAMCKNGYGDQVIPVILEHVKAMQTDTDAQAVAKCGEAFAMSIGASNSIMAQGSQRPSSTEVCEAFKESE